MNRQQHRQQQQQQQQQPPIQQQLQQQRPVTKAKLNPNAPEFHPDPECSVPPPPPATINREAPPPPPVSRYPAPAPAEVRGGGAQNSAIVRAADIAATLAGRWHQVDAVFAAQELAVNQTFQDAFSEIAELPNAPAMAAAAAAAAIVAATRAAQKHTRESGGQLWAPDRQVTEPIDAMPPYNPPADMSGTYDDGFNQMNQMNGGVPYGWTPPMPYYGGWYDESTTY
eukprot:Filipodium_phascolosomae@DN1132_c0_g1_i1.p1